MSAFAALLESTGLMPPLDAAAAQAVAEALGAAAGLDVYPRSVTAADGVVYALGRSGLSKRLIVACAAEGCSGCCGSLSPECRTVTVDGAAVQVSVLATDHEAAEMLRHTLPFLVPRVVGVTRSVGMGDRLGIGTPGHVRAVRGSGVVPIFAQQSIREMGRTGRTPENVMDDALWGVLQEGWRDGFGADADHLKTEEDVAACVEAGFVMFTVDPGDHVNDSADALTLDLLEAEFEALPWPAL